MNRRKKINRVVLNFSGHALSKEAKNELKKKFDKIEEIPFLNINLTNEVGIQLRRIIKKVKTPLDGSISITIIPPGQSTLSILLIMYLHGILGYFPDICMLDVTQSGIYLPSNIFYVSGNKLRYNGRAFRQEIWKLKTDF